MKKLLYCISYSFSLNTLISAYIPILTPEEVGKYLHLDSEIVKWLKNEPVNDKDLLLILDFKVAFVNYRHYKTNKDVIFNDLVGLLFKFYFINN